MNFYEQRLSFLRDTGFYPNVIYHIGTSRAASEDLVELVFPKSNFYLFEVTQDNVPCLSEKEKRRVVFHVTKTGDSGFDFEKNCEQRVLQMVTLSSLVKEHQLPTPNLVKIDVQGGEKEVIEGAKEILLFAEAVILGARFIQYNQRAPLFLEMANIMDQLGFQMFDLLETGYLPSKNLVNLDVLFIKKDSKFLPDSIMPLNI